MRIPRIERGAHWVAALINGECLPWILFSTPNKLLCPCMEHFDVIIVGAGLSGIGAACHLKMNCPAKRFVILEGRSAMGGTWDLFRYPGVRSDSDMYTLGYRFRPWRDAKAIADGPAILDYIRDTAKEYEVDKAIRYGHRVRRASWSTDRAVWTLDVDTD